MNAAAHYDLLVIGSGQAGNPLAADFAAKGKRVALVERGAVGGTCVNYGCTPTKTMIASAEVAYLARRAADFGVHAGEVTVDMRAVVERKRRVVETYRQGNEKRLAAGTDLLRGEASFTGPKQVRVRLTDGTETHLTADLVVIDTGLSPTLPDIDGIGSVPTLDNESAMELDRVPGHLLVLGGGYIGVEFAQMFRRFGADVTVVQHGAHLLAEEDPDVAEAIAAILREDGVTLHLNTAVTAVAPSATGIRLTLSSSGHESSVEGTDLLVATSRKPNTAALNLPAAGIHVDPHGYIPVNERLETTVPGVYAVGDVKGGPQFTHIAYDDYRILKANLLDGGSRVTTGRPVPYCVYLDPQLGRIGLTETMARQASLNFRVATLNMTGVARAFETSQTRGFMKAIVDADTHLILGAAILGAEGGEIMSMLQIAMSAKVPCTVLRDAILAHPTFAESLNNLFSKIEL